MLGQGQDRVGSEIKSQPSESSHQNTQRVMDNSRSDTVTLYFDSGKYKLDVPKEYLVYRLSTPTTPRVIGLPVRDSDDNLYDAALLLDGLDSRVGHDIPSPLTFDDNVLLRKTDYFVNAHENSRHLSLNSEAYKELKKQLDWEHWLTQTTSIVEKARLHNVEIIQEPISDIPLIAVEKNSLLGFQHRKGMMNALCYATVNQSFSALFGSSMQFTVIDAVLIPVLSYMTSKAVHPAAKDWKTKMTSLYHVSLPTVGLYGGTMAATYAFDYFLKATVAAKLYEDGVTGPRAMTVMFLLPVSVGFFAVGLYQKGRMIAAKAQEATSGMSALMKRCGMKLWGSAAALAPADQTLADEMDLEMNASLLPKP